MEKLPETISVESFRKLYDKLNELSLENRRLQALKAFHDPPKGKTRNRRSAVQESLEERFKSHKELSLKFSALEETIRASQRSSLIKKYILFDDPSKSLNNGFSSINPEETLFITELLDEQDELSEETMCQQEQIIQSELDILEKKKEMLATFGNLKLLSEPLRENRTKEQLPPKVSSKLSRLEYKERKVNQMKFMIQNILSESAGWSPDELKRQKNRDILMKCGKDISELRNEL